MRNLLVIFSLLGVFFFALPSSAHAANRYWVGSSGGATNDNANWASSDPASCTGGGASAPSTGDIAIFDADCDNNAAVTGTFSVQGVSMVSGYSGTISQNAVAMTIGSAGWVQAGGTFTGNSDGSAANITINSGGDFSLSGGIFTSTNDTLTLGDNVTFSGGTYTHNSGTALIKNNGDTPYSVNQDITGPATFYNLTFESNDSNGGSNEYTLTTAETVLTVNNTLTMTNAAGTNTSCILIAPGSIIAKGDITTSFQGCSGDAVITINGTGTQTVTGNTNGDSNYTDLIAVSMVPAINIDKASGTLFFASSIMVMRGWTYTQGTVDTSTNTSTIVMNGNYPFGYGQSAVVITGSMSFYNLMFYAGGANGNGITYTVSSGTNLTVTNTLTYSDRDTNYTCTINGPGTITAQGNIVATQAGCTGDIAVTLSGSAAQTITQSALSFPTGTFTINKTSGTATLATNLSLSGSGQDLLISRGTLDLASYTLTVNDSITVSGGGVLKSYSGGDVVVGSGGFANAGQVNLGNPQTCGAADSSAITSSSGGVARTWSGNGLINLYDVAITDQTESPFKGNGVIWSGTNNGNTNFRVMTTCPTPANSHWQFDEGQGTSANDSSANANTGTLAGTTVPAWRTEDQCVSGKCLFFDGSTSNVTVANVISQVQTISMWVKPTSVADIALIDLDGGTHRITVSSGTITATGFTSPTIYVNGVINSTLVTNQWQLVTVTTGTAFNSTSSLTIGKYTSGSKFFPGFIDSPKIYNYALSSSQIKSDFLSKGANDLAGTVLGVNTQNNAAALSNGLVGYWKMDEAAGGSATESSGNANTGTYTNGATNSTGKFANGGSFDGTDDYIDAGSGSSLDNITSSSMTVSFWAKSTAGGGTRTFIAKESGGSNGWNFRCATGGQLVAHIEASTTSASSQSSNSGLCSDSSNWHLFTMTYDNNGDRKIRLFRDTVEVSYTSQIAAVGTLTDESAQTLKIGYRGYELYFSGTMDEARVYNRALSGAEVSQLYNWAPGPVGYWKMDEGSWNGTSGEVKDSSGNGNNGTIVSSPTITQGKYGKAGQFVRASSQGVTVANSTSTTNIGQGAGVTTMGWVNLTTSSAGVEYTLLNQAGGDGRGINLRAANNGGGPIGEVDCATNNGSAISSVGYSIGTWTHVAMTFDTSTGVVKTFVNGVDTSSSQTTCTGGVVANSSSVLIGKLTATQPMNGKIDEVKLYNYPRTQAQIIEDMNGGHPAPGSPVGSSVAYWKFDEGYGTTANDSTPNDNDLTLNTATSAWTNSAKFSKGWVGLGTNWASRADDADLDFEAVDDGTISMWFKSTSATNPGAQEYLLSKGPGSTAAGYAIYVNTSGQICFGVDDDTTFGPDDSSCSTADIYDGTFHHISAVKTGTTSIQLFVDGKAQTADSSISATGTLANSSTLYVGDFNGSDNGNEFNGTLDEIKVYRSALNISQINLDLNQSSAQVVGSLSSTQSAPNAASSIYCIPGDASTCTGPVGEWNLDEGSGSTANDSSGNENSCSGVSTWVNGKVNKAVSFDTTVRLSCGSGSSVDNLGPLTAEAWIYPRTMGEFNYGNIMNKGVNSAGWTLAMKGWGTNGLFFSKDLSGSDVERATADNSITLNTWNHIVVTWDGSTTGSNIHIYVNGKETGYTDTANGSGTNSDASNTLYIGETDGQNNGFDGLIDQVKLFNYVRTPAQVAWDYNRGLPIAHWEFDECQGTTIHDSSGNSLSGTWSGSGGGNTTVGTCNTAGTAWGDGAVGKKNYSIDFDGSDDSINFGNPTLLEPTGPIAISMWVKPASGALSSGEHAMIHNYDGGGTTAQYELAFMSGVLEFNYGASSSYVSYVPTPAVSFTAGNWYHIIFTHSGSNSTGYFYINGVKYNSTKTGSATIPTGGNGDTLVGASTYSGLLDDIKMFHYTLTDAQAKTLYNDNAAYKTGPVTGAP